MYWRIFTSFCLVTVSVLAQGQVQFTGSARTRLEGWDWFGGGEASRYAYSGSIFRFGLSQQRRTLDWQVEFAAPVLLGLPEDAVLPAPRLQSGLGGNYFAANDRARNAAMLFPKQAFVRFKNVFGDSASLRVGRFEFNDGAEVMPKEATLAAVKRDRITQRLIGTFGWTHVGRSFDGVHFSDQRGNLNVTFVGATPTRGVFQVDGWGRLDVAFGYLSATGQRPGKQHSGEWRVFGIYYHDWRNVVKTDSRPAAVRAADRASIRIGSFGGHYLHSAATGAGTFDLLAWGLGQTGRWGRLDHRAASFAGEAGWQPPVWANVKPWVRGGYHRSTGDGDPNDGTHGTFFQILPTPRPYARFPFFDLVNNEDVFGALILRPHKALTLRTEVHGLRLSDRSDLWYLGGGAFQPWSFGYIGRPSGGRKGLATLYDVSADWTVNAKTAVTVYYGHAAGGAVIRSIYPESRNGNFGYVELTRRF